ncbi:MAG: cobalamin biosynthesis protein CobQ [Pseudomonadota bacterium]
MNTITHTLVAAALLAKPGAPKRNAAVIAGATIPDLWLFLFYGYNKLVLGHPSETIWREIYWQPPWTDIGAIFNSMPLYTVFLLTGLLAPLPTITAFGAAALMHVSLDFPVHADDAHAHFWPFTMWRFQSPLSYWDPQHNGQLVSTIEGLVALALIALLWQRFSGKRVKLALILCAVSYLAVPVYFALSLGRA